LLPKLPETPHPRIDCASEKTPLGVGSQLAMSSEGINRKELKSSKILVGIPQVVKFKGFASPSKRINNVIKGAQVNPPGF
jgi:hypothetical protein